MDPLLRIAATAVVGAVAANALLSVHNAMRNFFQRKNEQETDSDELEVLLYRTNSTIIVARRRGDQHAEDQLVGEWTRHFRERMVDDPQTGLELHRFVFHILLPMLPQDDQRTVIRILITRSNDQVINQDLRGVRNHATGEHVIPPSLSEAASRPFPPLNPREEETP